MAADIDPTADPDRLAQCPRRLTSKGARCRAIVLVRDADEHELWHDELDDLLHRESTDRPPLRLGTWPFDADGHPIDQQGHPVPLAAGADEEVGYH